MGTLAHSTGRGVHAARRAALIAAGALALGGAAPAGAPAQAPACLAGRSGPPTPAGVLGIHRDGPFGVRDAQWFVPAVARAGVSWLRINIFRDSIARAPGSYDWAATDTAVCEAAAQGLGLVVTIRGGDMAWASGAPTADEQAYLDFVAAAVARYRAGVAVWQPENEVTSRAFWHHSIEDYLALVHRVSGVIHGASPAARVMLAGLRFDTFDLRRMDIRSPSRDGLLGDNERLVKESAGDVDLVDLHMYALPETMPARLTWLRDVMARDSANHPIWVTETGGPDYRVWQGVNPEARQVLEVRERIPLALAWGAQKVFWHTLSAMAGSRNPWASLALVSGLRQRPGYAALRNWGSRLGGFTAASELADSGGAHRILLETASANWLVVWAPAAAAVALPDTGGWLDLSRNRPECYRGTLTAGPDAQVLRRGC